jgi:hypothetical protein
MPIETPCGVGRGPSERRCQGSFAFAFLPRIRLDMLGCPNLTNWLFPLVTGVLCVISLCSLFTSAHWLAWLAIVGVDLHLIGVLFLAAARSDHPARYAHFFPRRTIAMPVVFFSLTAMVCGFAGLYLQTGVFRGEQTPTHALYVSFLILGFSDLAPRAGLGERLVIWELASAVLLLMGGFPLLISRIASLGEANQSTS